jgi:hypothetical protein
MAAGMENPDRRRHPRIPVQVEMQARLLAENVDTVGRVIDLNNAGAFVATALVLPKNSKLRVELRIPGMEKESCPLEAMVARHSEEVKGRETTIPAGLGIVFLVSTAAERAFIQRAVLEALRSSLEATRAQVAVGSGSASPAENSSR